MENNNTLIEQLDLLTYVDIDELAPIPKRLEYIEPILTLIEQSGDHELLQEAVNLVKTRVQYEARLYWYANGRNGLLSLATGVGKSRTAIMDLLETENLEQGDVLIVVPTQKLRDTGWKEEFEKWGASNIYSKIELVCYDSLKNMRDKHYNKIYLDEVQNITDGNLSFFREHGNSYAELLALTATRPKANTDKSKILDKLELKTDYTVTTDEAIALRLIAPYDMVLVGVQLGTEPVIEAGNKKNRFMQSEVAAYKYQCKLVNESTRENRSRVILGRRRFLKTLPSLEKSAKFILDKFIGKEERTLIFAGSKEQAMALCEHTYISKPSFKEDDTEVYKAKIQKQLERYRGEEDLEAFCRGEISRIASVKKLNEGANLPMLDVGLAIGLDSDDGGLVQMLGRLLRYRIGHRGKFIVLVALGTEARDWAYSAISGINPDNIKRVMIEDLISGKETI